MGVRDIYRDRGSTGHIPILKGQTLLEEPYRALVDDANTVGLWLFDEEDYVAFGNGSNSYIFSTSYQYLRDRHANAHRILYTGPTWTANGPWGRALSFDGTNDFAAYEAQAALLCTQTNCTIEAVIRSSVADFADEDPIYVEGTSAFNRFRLIRLGNKLEFCWLNQAQSQWYSLTSTSTPTWTNWNYFAATNANLTRTLYTNGLADGSDAAAGVSFNTGVTYTYVCKYPDAGFFGTFELAYLRISNSARTAAEILTNAKLMGFA
jgi:hypothetical protein